LTLRDILHEMPIIFQKLIFRLDLRANLDVYYLFADNEQRTGLGGQAKEMRGEPNAIGIRTKVAPNIDIDSYWSDENLQSNIQKLYEDFLPVKYLLEQNKVVVIPLDGFGTGLAELPRRAPKTLKYIELVINKLHERFNKKDKVG
jgi:hypothetical protein